MPPGEHVWRERGLRDAVLAGDERAWQTLYDETFADLAAYVRWRCGGLRDLAEEVVQETWLTAVRLVARFDPEQGAFLSWLRGIASNVLQNALRRKKRFVASRAPEAANDETERREQAEAVTHALAELPPHYEAVLRAKYLEQLSMEEIAAAWGQSAKSIESLLTRARAAFRAVYPAAETLRPEITP